MRPALHKLNLTAHVASSVGWFGAVATFLALSIAGLTSHGPEIVRAAYLSMNLIGQFIIVPLSFAALSTGLIQSLGTHWGLFRHYWVLMKFTLTIGATMLLLLHQFTAVSRAASRVAGTPPGTFPEVGRVGMQLVGDSSLALLVLLTTATLSVYKPWGRTRYGRRKQQELLSIREGVRLLAHPQNATPAEGLPMGLKILIGSIISALAVGIIFAHLSGGHVGLHGH